MESGAIASSDRFLPAHGLQYNIMSCLLGLDFTKERCGTRLEAIAFPMGPVVEKQLRILGSILNLLCNKQTN